MSRLKIGVTSIIGLTAALAARPAAADVHDMINAARLAANQKFVVNAMNDLAVLQGTKPGDIVTVVTGESGDREVREVVALDGNGFVQDSIVIERNRTVEVPVTDQVVVGPNGELVLSYSPAHGLDSIANFGNALFTDPDTGESAIYNVADDGAGGFTVDAELAGKTVKVQYSRTEVLAVNAQVVVRS